MRPDPSDDTERLRAARETPGPILRRGSGALPWFDARRRRTGHWAFSTNRAVALGLVFYLYLHLAVLSTLLRGASAWRGFLRLATTPAFLGLDAILIVGLLYHGLDGLRVALIGTGIAVDRQRALFWSAITLGAILALGGILRLIKMA